MACNYMKTSQPNQSKACNYRKISQQKQSKACNYRKRSQSKAKGKNPSTPVRRVTRAGRNTRRGRALGLDVTAAFCSAASGSLLPGGWALPGAVAWLRCCDPHSRSQGMRRLRLNQDWIGRIRLALTIVGLPYAVCKPETSPSAAAWVHNPYTNTLRMTSSTVAPPLHLKSRCQPYPGSQIKRFPVPDDKVDWSKVWPQYLPVQHTDPNVASRPTWADPDLGSKVFSPRFNCVDGAVDRTSFLGDYKLLQNRPLNPRGRTGLAGRGLLGRWGPNHAADPIVTRWKVDAKGQKVSHPASKRPVLQFISIKRKDCGEWAIPGGMVDPGEMVTLTLQREFSEEALNSLALPAGERAQTHQRITQLFKGPGLQVYRGYVDDPRNTDNAWMETVAVNFHDETGNSVSELPLQAGDDAGQVTWVDLDSAFPLYASHSHFLETVAKERGAHW
ncbi:ADP-ribose pyrophosphatase, mitochondrial isoform X2 [Gadus morhua]|uniref:ADP-ribose pyrophosphatase, mitochondrial isoform X2 n=1 Tax=Gadus morhua TaxID=8049 RepID=UPI0011B849F6|nr:ADP-ribose pyrophosphatase, mitochondrial isoform X2 [Gadus morhua]